MTQASGVGRPGLRGRELIFVVNTVKYFLSHRLGLARAARDAGLRVTVVTDARVGGGVERITAEGFEVCPMWFGRGGSFVRELWSLASILHRRRGAIVHLVGLKASLLGGMLLRLRPGSHVVMALTGLGFVFTSASIRARALRLVVEPALRWVMSNPRCVVLFQNRDDLQSFVARGYVAAERAELVLGSGVDLSVFHPDAEPEGRLRVLFAGRILGDKGVREFVAAARACAGEPEAPEFLIAGGTDEGNPSSIGAAELESWRRDRSVTVLGEVEDIGVVMRACHIICLPSYREGLPKVLIEAAATGRAMIATDVPGCREVVVPGRTGLLVPARDAEGLARAIMELVRDAARRNAYARNARAMAEDLFGLDAVNAQTLRIYQRVIVAGSSDEAGGRREAA